MNLAQYERMIEDRRLDSEQRYFTEAGVDTWSSQHKRAALTHARNRSSESDSSSPNILGIEANRLYRDKDSCIGWAYQAAE